MIVQRCWKVELVRRHDRKRGQYHESYSECVLYQDVQLVRRHNRNTVKARVNFKKVVKSAMPRNALLSKGAAGEKPQLAIS